MIHNLIKNITSDFIPDSYDDMEIYNENKDYLDFIKSNNGGYFYNNSLHIFGSMKRSNYHDINYLNNLYHMSYGKLVKDIFFFAEDLFGNPFGFFNQNVIHLNLETSDKEVVSKDFIGWLKEINNDLDYFTGQSLLQEFKSDDIYYLAYGKRIGAKYPFVLGGEYAFNNLILKDFEENIEYNASIAKQIIDLPDGAKVQIDIKY